MSAFRSLAGATALACVALSACSKDNTVTGPAIAASTTYSGLVVNASVTARLAITFPTAVASVVGRPAMNLDVLGALDNIGAVLTLSGGGTVSLTGTYTAPNLSVSGGGWTFTGTISNGIITGTFTGPSGPGDFEALSSPAGSPATVMCGTNAGTDNTGSPTSGTFHLIIGSGVFLIIVDNGLVLPQGTYTGTTFDAYTKSLNTTSGSSSVTIHGTFNSTSASGSYSVHNSDGTSDAGTWTAGACT